MLNKLFLAFLFLALFSCKKAKKDDIVPPTNPSPPGSITVISVVDSIYFPYLFDKNSYWIYKDTATNEKDSVAVTNITKYTVTENYGGFESGTSITYDKYHITYSSSYFQTTYTEIIGMGTGISRGPWNRGGRLLLVGGAIGYKDKNAEVLANLNTLAVESYTFNDVTKMKVDEDEDITGNYNLYYTPNIGLIKKEVRENGLVTRTWNLESYEVALVANP